MKKILLVSHGLMAMGIYEAAKMIIGECADIRYICLSNDKDIEEFKAELVQNYNFFKDCKQLFVLADIGGGSPYITTLAFLQEKNMLEKSNIIAGMNLPLVLGISLGQNLDDKKKVLEIVDESRQAVQLFEVSKEEEDEL